MSADEITAPSPAPEAAPALDAAARLYRDNAKEFVAARQNDAEANMQAQLAALQAEEAGAIPAPPPAVVGAFAIEGLGEAPVLSVAAQEDEALKAALIQKAPVDAARVEDAPVEDAPAAPVAEGEGA